MRKLFVVAVIVMGLCGQLRAESITVGGNRRAPAPAAAEPVATRVSNSRSMEPIVVLVERGSVNDNMERIVSQLGWSAYFPHYMGSLVIRKTFTLELLPSRLPVSPEYMSDVIHNILNAADGAKVKPFLHIPDRVVVLASEGSAR